MSSCVQLWCRRRCKAEGIGCNADSDGNIKRMFVAEHGKAKNTMACAEEAGVDARDFMTENENERGIGRDREMVE